MILELLSLQPVQKGLIALVLAAILLPICGIPLVEMSLLPLRIMLMHGAIFAGTIAIVLGFSPTPFMIGVNVLFILIMTWVNRERAMDLGRLSAFFMVTSLGGASLLSHRFQLGGQALQSLLWGSPFLLSSAELFALIIWASVVIVLFIRFRRVILLHLFEPSGSVFISYSINVVIAISVALVMKLLGALLVDVMLLLPVVLAGFGRRGFNSYIKSSIIYSLTLSILGIGLSLKYNLPVSGIMALTGGVFFIVLLMKTLFGRRR